MTKLRSDAAVRRDLILDAADAVFSGHGVTAPLELVVERAGVGRATLYRNFPHRASLIEALLERSLDSLEEYAAQHAGREDKLFLLLERIASRIVESPAMADYWRTMPHDDPIISAARERMRHLFRIPVKHAIDAGLCRPDFTVADMSLIFGMLGASLRGHSPASRRTLATRALELLRSGIAAPSRTGAQCRNT